MVRASTVVLVVSLLRFVSLSPEAVLAAGIIIDHNETNLTALPQAAISRAKADLHIAYGHTSHGSQITDGMSGLVEFTNSGGLGLSYSPNFFAWNNGGLGGALDLHDYAMGEDVGYYPQWVDNTRAYLDNPSHSDVNVIIWSWCGQVGDKYVAGTLNSEYLTPMTQLEAEYPDVTFVYMTGHVDHWDDTNNKAANQMIRDFCIDNDKVLYDFADIESYDPDGTYFEFPHDNSDYYASVGGPRLGNWATEWQNSHTEGIEWYDCPSAHSTALNANRKAYAAWNLWATIATANADANADGQVDRADTAVLAANYGRRNGATYWQGDFDGDGMVGLSDLAIMKAHLGEGVAGSAAAVPEPSAVVLAVVGPVIFLACGWRRRSG